MLRIIGDVHGFMHRYQELIRGVDYSVQVGDMGFADDYGVLVQYVDSEKHKFIAGNHDEYPALPKHALHGYGTCEIGSHQFYYVSGAYSIDKEWRTPGKSWWEEEELTYAEGMKALEHYAEVKPELVITHSCPLSIVPLALNGQNQFAPSRTQQLLEQMWTIHPPKRWYFGHFHNTKAIPTPDTDFFCLGELAYTDID
jgi:hypothetical protein